MLITHKVYTHENRNLHANQMHVCCFKQKLFFVVVVVQRCSDYLRFLPMELFEEEEEVK